jgi:hypothetical protein
MDYDEYGQLTQRVAELVDKDKDYAQAVTILQTLIDSDLTDIDKSMMCVNMATVCNLMGHEDHALAWFDHGIALEQPLMRDFVAMRKAAYLVEKGRKAEAEAIYEQLLPAPFLTLNEREQIKHNLKVIRGG